MLPISSASPVMVASLQTAPLLLVDDMIYLWKRGVMTPDCSLASSANGSFGGAGAWLLTL